MITKIKDAISYAQLTSGFGDQFYLSDLKVYQPDRSYFIVADAKIRTYKAAGDGKYGDRRAGYRCYSHGSCGENLWVSEEFDDLLIRNNLQAVRRSASNIEPRQVRWGHEIEDVNIRLIDSGTTGKKQSGTSSGVGKPRKQVACCELTAPEIDKAFRQLSEKTGGIGKESKKFLANRGLSPEEIDFLENEYGYFSYSDADVFDNDLRVPQGFPGSWYDSKNKCYRPQVSGYWDKIKKKFINNNKGIAVEKLIILAKSIEGLYLGAQVTIADEKLRAKAKCKYWQMSHDGAPSKLRFPFKDCQPLENPEQPLAFCRPIPRKNRNIQSRDSCLASCEGLLKPAIAAMVHGTNFIGASGGNHLSSPRQLEKTILECRRQSPCLEPSLFKEADGTHKEYESFVFLDCLDAGAVENTNIIGDLLSIPDWKRAVRVYDPNKEHGNLEQYGKLGKLCAFVRKLGINYRVHWYGQFRNDIGAYQKKLAGDCDEATKSKISYALSVNSEELSDDVGGRTISRRSSKRLISFEQLIQIGKRHQFNKSLLNRQLGYKVGSDLVDKNGKKYNAIANHAKGIGYKVHTAEEKDFYDSKGNFVGVKQFIEVKDIPRGTLAVLLFDQGSGKTAACESVKEGKILESKEIADHLVQALDFCKRHKKNLLDPIVAREVLGDKSSAFTYLLMSNFEHYREIEDEIDSFYDCDTPIERIYLIGYSNALLSATSRRLGIEHKPKVMQLYGNKRYLRLAKTISFCGDSALDFYPKHAAGATIIIDEIEAVINHVFLGSTCHSKREKILNRLRDLMLTALNTNGRVILMGAGITQLTLDTIEMWLQIDKSISYNKLFFGSAYKKEDRKWDCYVYPGTVKVIDTEESDNKYKVRQSDPLIVVMQALQKLQEGKRVFFHTDKKIIAQIFHELANSLSIDGLLFTSDDGEDMGKHECMADPNGFLKKEKESASSVQYIAASPFISSGISFEEEYFDHVFGVFFGVVDTDEAIQMLCRVRANVDRHVWFANTCGRGMPSPDTLDDLDKASRLFEEKQVMSLSNQVFKYSYNKLQFGTFCWGMIPKEADNYDNICDRIERALNAPDKYVAEDIKIEEVATHNRYNAIKAKLITHRNRDGYLYRRSGEFKLRNKAKNFTIVDDPEKLKVAEAAWDSFQEARNRVEFQKATAIAEARNLTNTEAEILRQKEVYCAADRNALLKYYFKQKTYGEVPCTVENILELAVKANWRKLDQMRGIAEVLDIKSSEISKLPEYYFTLSKIEGEVIKSDLPPCFASAMRAIGGEELLINPQRVWNDRELNKFFKRKFDDNKIRNQASLFGVWCDRRLENFGAKVAEKILSKLGFVFERRKDGSYKIKTENNFDNKIWVLGYEAVAKKLKADAYNAVEALKEHLSKRGIPEYDKRYTWLPTVEKPPTPNPVPEEPLPQQTKQEPDIREEQPNSKQLELLLWQIPKME